MEEVMSVVAQILTSNGGAFGTVVVIMGAVIYVIIMATKKITRMTVDFEHRSSKFDKVDNTIDDIRRDLVYIKGTMEFMKNTIQQTPVQAHSPLSPNEVGRKIIEELQLNDIIARNADRIMNHLNSNIGSRNPYDIQQYCIETASIELDKLFYDADVNIIKTYAFNHGQSLFYYGSLIGVLVRDLYFERHRIPLDDVDKHDPAKP